MCAIVLCILSRQPWKKILSPNPWGIELTFPNRIGRLSRPMGHRVRRKTDVKSFFNGDYILAPVPPTLPPFPSQPLSFILPHSFSLPSSRKLPPSLSPIPLPVSLSYPLFPSPTLSDTLSLPPASHPCPSSPISLLLSLLNSHSLPSPSPCLPNSLSLA